MALQPPFTVTLDEVRHHYELASRFQTTLSERDLALLPLAESRTRDTEDRTEMLERAKAVVARFPKDAYVQVLLGQALAGAGKLDEADAAFDHAEELDPGSALPLWVKAVAHDAASDYDGAMKDYDECTRRVPAASSCVRGRLHILSARGSCRELEQGAKELILLEPNGGAGYFWLAHALAGKGAPVASVREALAKQSEKTDRDPSRKRALDITDAWELDALGGDFAAAGQAASDWMKATAGETSESILAQPYEAAMLTFLEVGDDASAVSTAQELLDRAAAWTHDGSGRARGLAFAILERAKKLSAAELSRRRDAAVKDARGRLEGKDPIQLWLDFYAVPSLTKEQAIHALEVQTGFGRLPEATDVPESEGLGRSLLLARWYPEATMWLRKATLSCEAALDPIQFVHAHGELGHAYEEQQQDEQACHEYQVVLDRWGAAKPRSVTVDDARARMAALHCSP
jgi:tetratricopeptide (TPR) repeat protein